MPFFLLPPSLCRVNYPWRFEEELTGKIRWWGSAGKRQRHSGKVEPTAGLSLKERPGGHGRQGQWVATQMGYRVAMKGMGLWVLDSWVMLTGLRAYDIFLILFQHQFTTVKIIHSFMIRRWNDCCKLTSSFAVGERHCSYFVLQLKTGKHHFSFEEVHCAHQ